MSMQTKVIEAKNTVTKQKAVNKSSKNQEECENRRRGERKKGIQRGGTIITKQRLLLINRPEPV